MIQHYNPETIFLDFTHEHFIYYYSERSLWWQLWLVPFYEVLFGYKLIEIPFKAFTNTTNCP